MNNDGDAMVPQCTSTGDFAVVMVVDVIPKYEYKEIGPEEDDVSKVVPHHI